VGRSFAGALLVVLGVALLLIELTGVGGVAVVLLGGLAFLATYLATRSYGFLVPGGILTGFGGALVAEDLGLVGDVNLAGLGVGFLLIPLVQLLSGGRRDGGWWWPVVPGGILTGLGVVEHLQGDTAGLILPGLLIILGLSFLLSATRRSAAQAAAARREAEEAAAGALGASGAPPADAADAAAGAERAEREPPPGGPEPGTSSEPPGPDDPAAR
jgi:hypothetical protein